MTSPSQSPTHTYTYTPIPTLALENEIVSAHTEEELALLNILKARLDDEKKAVHKIDPASRISFGKKAVDESDVGIRKEKEKKEKRCVGWCFA